MKGHMDHHHNEHGHILGDEILPAVGLVPEIDGMDQAAIVGNDQAQAHDAQVISDLKVQVVGIPAQIGGQFVIVHIVEPCQQFCPKSLQQDLTVNVTVTILTILMNKEE